MNFQFLPTAGLLPQAAVPVYGAPPGSGAILGQVMGARGVIGAPPGQLPLLAAQGSGLTVASSVSQAALLSGMRQTLGVAGSQAMLTPGGTRFMMPPTSQSVVGGMPQMLVMQGGMVPSVDASIIGSQSGEKPASDAAGQLDVKEEKQSADLLFDQQLAQHSLAGTAGRPLVPQSLLMAQSAGSQPVMLAHPQTLQEPPLPPPFFASHPSLVGHPGFAAFSGLPPPPGLTVFPGMAAAQQGLPGFSGVQDYQSLLNQQQMSVGGQQIQEELVKNDGAHVSQASDSQLSSWQDLQQKQQYPSIDSIRGPAEGVSQLHLIQNSQQQQQHQEVSYPITYSGEYEQDPDEPVVHPERTVLDFFNSDLHLEISRDGYVAEAMTKPPGFCFCWAGSRATYGVCSGKVCFEMLILEHLDVDFGEDHQESDPHIVRIGWSMDNTSFQLGEEDNSWGFGGTAKFSTNNKFSNYGKRFGKGDVVMAMIDFESRPPKMSFAVNGAWLGVASPLHGYKVGSREHALFPHVLSKNCRFQVNFGQQEPWFAPPLPGFTFIDHMPLQSRVRGMLAPPRKADCEMIMVVGLPGAGKTTWAQNLLKQCPQKRYNIIGTDTLIDKMRVMGLPRRNNYHGRWEILIQKATNCLNKLFQIASRRRRNYILDQTNVYASARKRKMRHFVGFRRICAVLQPEDEELKRREWKRTFEDGKVVPEEAVLEMKMNYSLPHESDEHVDDIMWIEMSREKSEELIKAYVAEAQEKLPPRDPSYGRPGFNSNQKQAWQDQGSSGRGGRTSRFSDNPDGMQPPSDKRQRTDNRGALDYIKHEYEEQLGTGDTGGRSGWNQPSLPVKHETHQPSTDSYGSYGGGSSTAAGSSSTDQNAERFAGGFQQPPPSATNYWDTTGQGQSTMDWNTSATAQSHSDVNTPNVGGYSDTSSVQQQYPGYMQPPPAPPLAARHNVAESEQVSVKTESLDPWQQQSNVDTGYQMNTGSESSTYRESEDYYSKWNEWSQAYSQATQPPSVQPPSAASQSGQHKPEAVGAWGYPPPPPPPPSSGFDQSTSSVRPGQISSEVKPPVSLMSAVPPYMRPMTGFPPPGMPPPTGPPPSVVPPAGFPPPGGMHVPPPGMAVSSGPPARAPTAMNAGFQGQAQQPMGYDNQSWYEGGDNGGANMERADTGRQDFNDRRFGHQPDDVRMGMSGPGMGRGSRGPPFDERGPPDRFGRDNDRMSRDMGRNNDQSWRDRDRDMGQRDRDREPGRDFGRGEREHWKGERDRFGRESDRYRDPSRGDRDGSRGGRDDRDDRGPVRGGRDQGRDRDLGRDRPRDRDRDFYRDNRDRDFSRDRDRDSGRDSNRERERDRDSGRDRDRERERDRDRDRSGRDRDRDQDRGVSNESLDPGRSQRREDRPKRASRWEPETETKAPTNPDQLPKPAVTQEGILGSPPKAVTPHHSLESISQPQLEFSSNFGSSTVAASSNTPFVRSSPLMSSGSTGVPSLISEPVRNAPPSAAQLTTFSSVATGSTEPARTSGPGVNPLLSEEAGVHGEMLSSAGGEMVNSVDDDFDESSAGHPFTFRGPRPFGPPRNRFVGPPRGPAPPPPRPGQIPRMSFGGPPGPPTRGMRPARPGFGPPFQAMGGTHPPRGPPGPPSNMRGGPPRWPRQPSGPPRPFR